MVIVIIASILEHVNLLVFETSRIRALYLAIRVHENWYVTRRQSQFFSIETGGWSTIVVIASILEHINLLVFETPRIRALYLAIRVDENWYVTRRQSQFFSIETGGWSTTVIIASILEHINLLVFETPRIRALYLAIRVDENWYVTRRQSQFFSVETGGWSTIS